MAAGQTSQKLKKEFKQVSDGLTALDRFHKADALLVEGKFINPTKAIEYLNNIINYNRMMLVPTPSGGWPAIISANISVPLRTITRPYT